MTMKEQRQSTVKVIKNNARKQCVCEHCGSILEYGKDDVKDIRIAMNEWENMIHCPACDCNTRISKVPSETREMDTFNK